MAATADQTSSRITLIGIALIWLMAQISAAVANDSGINRDYRNPPGEWCCGDHDCESPDQIAVTGKGWVASGTGFVPFEEATPSPDGKIWICRRPDHTLRCVSGP